MDNFRMLNPIHPPRRRLVSLLLLGLCCLAVWPASASYVGRYEGGLHTYCAEFDYTDPVTVEVTEDGAASVSWSPQGIMSAGRVQPDGSIMGLSITVLSLSRGTVVIPYAARITNGVLSAQGASSGISSALTATQAPCGWALTAQGANHGSQATSGSFGVSANAACGWSATASAGTAWLHTASSGSGSGSGTVAYTVDANPTATFRTGTITVGGETFTVTQGPAGYDWHRSLGWLFVAGDGWKHADGFGWLWFHPGGQWIWSANLQGWLAVTDPDSPTLWSTQFRWLTPSTTDAYRADTTAIGVIYLGRHQGVSIPDGWVVSERFGYVWANGDGTWYYSDTAGWLGVTPTGGIWSASLGRFL
jgi:hypothetical protein